MTVQQDLGQRDDAFKICLGHVQKEDDGVVLTAVTGADGSSFLLVLDSSSFTELARCTLPNPLPYGFHGQWLAAA